MCDNCKRCVMPPTQNRQRRKLWEIRSDMHCSILGTCLEHSELMKIAYQSGQIPDKNVTEYQVHSHFVQQADEPGRPSRLMHKKLDQKYQTAVRTFGSAKTEAALGKLWEESLEKGDVPGPFWALMSHPCLTESLLVQAFGEVHMLSHLNGATNHAKTKSLQNARKALTKTKRQLILQSERRQSLINDHARQIRELEQRLTIAEQDNRSVEAMSARLREFEKGDLYHTLEREAAKLRTDLERTEQVRDDYASRLDRQSRELSALKLEYAKAIKQIEVLNRLSTRNERNENQSDNNPGPSAASEPENLDLFGKSVAYVGGRAGMMSNFRNLIENFNGNLLHHDGGIQDNMKSLAGILSRADIVLCPVECVSHGACNKAKSYCKRAAKPFVPLRTTGVSSLMSGLKQAVEFDYGLNRN
ncbi:MAG: DUF2325 domain-containing protein [Gammaproteobacteria bacterium]|nr:DUF2325 domain-containing protein [Gammaproteobacteria bacterium]